MKYLLTPLLVCLLGIQSIFAVTPPPTTNPNYIQSLLTDVKQIDVVAQCGSKQIPYELFMTYNADTSAYDFCGIISGLPSGQCDFHANAINADGDILYQGGVANSTIPSSGLRSVNLFLIGKVTVPSGGNTAPIIEEIGVEATTTGFELSVTAFDPESYWCSPGSNFSSMSSTTSWLTPPSSSGLVWDECSNGNASASNYNSWYGQVLTYQWTVSSIVCDGVSQGLGGSYYWTPTNTQPITTFSFSQSLLNRGYSGCNVVFQISVSDGSATSLHRLVATYSTQQNIQTTVVIIMHPWFQSVRIIDAMIEREQLDPSAPMDLLQSSINFTVEAGFVILDQLNTFNRSFTWDITVAPYNQVTQEGYYSESDATNCSAIFNDFSATNLSPDTTLVIPINHTAGEWFIENVLNPQQRPAFCVFLLTVCDNYSPVPWVSRSCSQRYERVTISNDVDTSVNSINTWGQQNCVNCGGFFEGSMDLRGIACFDDPEIITDGTTGTCASVISLCHGSLCDDVGTFVPSNILNSYREITTENSASSATATCNSTTYITELQSGIGGACPAGSLVTPVFTIVSAELNNNVDLSPLVTLNGPFFVNSSNSLVADCAFRWCTYLRITNFTQYVNATNVCLLYQGQTQYEIHVSITIQKEGLPGTIMEHTFTFISHPTTALNWTTGGLAACVSSIQSGGAVRKRSVAEPADASSSGQALNVQLKFIRDFAFTGINPAEYVGLPQKERKAKFRRSFPDMSDENTERVLMSMNDIYSPRRLGGNDGFDAGGRGNENTFSIVIISLMSVILFIFVILLFIWAWGRYSMGTGKNRELFAYTETKVNSESSRQSTNSKMSYF